MLVVLEIFKFLYQHSLHKFPTRTSDQYFRALQWEALVDSAFLAWTIYGTSLCLAARDHPETVFFCIQNYIIL